MVDSMVGVAAGTQRRILRFEIRVDDKLHEIAAGDVVLVSEYRGRNLGGDASERVEVWVDATLPERWPTEQGDVRRVQVFGTGQRLPRNAGAWVGSAVSGPFVWHVLEMVGE